MNRMSSKNIKVTIIIFMLIFCIRLLAITNSPYEHGESWRESDTESIAKNFVEEDFNIFHPQFNYDGPKPNYVQLEFQITTFLIAILYKAFGYHYALARIVPIIFFMGSVYFLYLIGKRHYPYNQVNLAILLYGILPLNIFFSRAIMPESAALFFYLGAYFFFLKWIDEDRKTMLFISAVFTSLAISQKIPVIFIGVAMLMVAIYKFRSKIFRVWELYAFSLISLIPPYLYFYSLKNIAEFKFVDGIAKKHILPKFFSAIFTNKALDFFKESLPSSFTLVAIILSIIGLLLLDWKKESAIGFWFIAIFIEVITIVAVIRFDYYLIFLSPLIALLGAKTLSYLNNLRFGIILTTIIILTIGYHSYIEILPNYIQLTAFLEQAEIVKQCTEKDDLIVVGTFSPALINACDRKGWRANIDYYDYIPKEPIAEINYFIEHGAKYFVPLKGTIYNDDGSYIEYLESNFEKIEIKEGYPIYKLR